MRYLDTGTRDPSQTLAKWLEEIVRGDVTELRLQTGYFALEGVGLLLPTLDRCKANNLATNILIGSNDANTLRDDVAVFIDILGIPRSGAQLGIVNFSGAYFHPKTYHIKRADGSQAAFVGSANLTASGLALHVEAGIALDTNDGDDQRHLTEIAAAIDRWFVEKQEGLTLVSSLATIDALTENGVLALAPPPRTASQDTGMGDSGRPVRPRLRPLFNLPRVRKGAGQPTTNNNPAASPIPAAAPTQTAATAVAAVLPLAPRRGFPQYFLFDPAAKSPTTGNATLSGTLLPGGAVGIVITLTKDSARHFAGETGTANITLPVPTVMSLRFGVGGVRNRPWANLKLQARYIGNNGTVVSQPTESSVQAYGYTKGETSSENIRLGVLTPAISSIVDAIKVNGWSSPISGNVALLEWPTPLHPMFRLTFIERLTPLYLAAEALLNSAKSKKQLVGKSACWLPANVAPFW